MAFCPAVDPASPLQFVINLAAGSSEAGTMREVIETALQAAGRRGDLLFSRPDGLPRTQALRSWRRRQLRWFEFSEHRLTEVLLFPLMHRVHIELCSNFFEDRP